jgi:tetratricopeptide (TPR) repeat protein
MSTTLIVRDATLAINGAPEKRRAPREHLRARVAEVAHMDERTAEECVEVLSAVAGGEGADPEVLEALVIVGLAQVAMAKRLNLPTLATGRRLAARYERSAEVDAAVAVLELLLQHFPGQESLERDLGQLMRRQGMVKDLVGRYFERARRLMREGRNNEAAGWLREVLQLDPARKDAARLLRDLRFKGGGGRARRRGSMLRTLLVIGGLALGVAFLGQRELRLRAEFLSLPSAAPGNAGVLKRRLGELERFIDQHPVWHGAFAVLSERTELRVQLAVLEEAARVERESAERAERERLEAADLSRQRGVLLAQSGDLRGALAALRQALEYGGPDWPHYARVSGDVSALEASLEDSP